MSTNPALVATVLLAAAAATVLVPGGGGGVAARPDRARPGGGARAARLAAVGAVGVAAGAVGSGSLPPRRLALLLVLLGAALAAARLTAGRRRRREAATTRGRVLEACEELRAELVAGRTTGQALARAAAEWAPLGPVAETDRLGGDVPAALRTAARRPGAEDLVPVAAAWHVAHRTGSGLADALGRVAEDLTAQRSLRRVVEGELASARATARLVAGLPLLSLLMGTGAGGDPWGFLLDSPAGLVCLALGVALGGLGLAWIEAIAAGVERTGP
ncbi:type II secretion system F family protein [Nocardioides sp. AX2bis]|uniref:type II secretion system F family protein n=1 Tax=Nocardioides sp. AX2bis TaxID=2653157 RepID=UPI0012F00C5C|nr:type II secretion system F family protein [Nocardioides sp. AX2bis]VXC25510.1 conserved membrane hypothetical protein [Nocardioides sp. AX2bis]